MAHFDRSKEKDVRIMHVRSARKTGRKAVTFAVLKDADRYYYEVAICGQRDNFCKKIGREMAVGRLLKDVSHQTYSVTKDYMEQLLKYTYRKMGQEYNEKAVSFFLEGKKHESNQ